MATINYKDPTSGNWVEIPIGGSSVTVDSELSSTSENPVQNKVINSALNGKLTAPTTPTADSAIVIGANGNVSTKLLTEFSNITPIESTPSEDASIMKGLTIGGTDYSLPRRYRHTIYFNTTTPNITIYYEDDSSSEITSVNEIPSWIYYSAYIPSWESGGVLSFYNDGSECIASGVFIDPSSNEVAPCTISLGDEFSQEVIEV